MSAINIAQLEEQLTKLPGQIRDQHIRVIEKEKELDDAKLAYDVEYGMALTGAIKNNATEKKAEATIKSKETYLKVIEAKYNLKKEEVALKYLENRFTSFRKIGSLETEMMRSQLSGN